MGRALTAEDGTAIITMTIQVRATDMAETITAEEGKVTVMAIPDAATETAVGKSF